MTGDRRGTDGDSPEQTSWLDDLHELDGGRQLPAPSTSRPPTPDQTAVPTQPTDRTPTDSTAGRSADQASESPLVAGIRRAGAFDDLQLVGSPVDYQYGRAVDARVTVDGQTHDVELRLFRKPADGEVVAPLLAQFDRWATVDDIDGVVSLLDGADDPLPWSCTPPIDATLPHYSFAEFTDALEHARTISETLAELHEMGVVHAGLDPGHVVYPAGGDRPHLDSIGLFDIYRRHDDSGTALDPRYAPPEYFDDRYGVVDCTTDVYGLGAILYRLCTGEVPYDGSLSTVREAVLTEPFPRPSATADIPEAVDEIVHRATSTDKFDRYETAAEFCGDLQELCRWFVDS